MRITVIADTHLRAGLAKLPDEVLDAIDRSELVLHAGDITTKATLEALNARATVHAVLGNNDEELIGSLPQVRLVECDGVVIGMVHDSGPSRTRTRRLHDLFPHADAVIFGHSHIPVEEIGIGGQLLFNPGSPTQRRAQPYASFGELEIIDGRIESHRIARIAAVSH